MGLDYTYRRLWCINRPLLGANGETSPILDFQPGYEFPGVLSRVTAGDSSNRASIIPPKYPAP